MEVIILLIAGALLAATLHKEPEKKPEPEKKQEPEKPEVKSFQIEKITIDTPEGKKVYTREITPVVNQYPVAWTESNNHRQ